MERDQKRFWGEPQTLVSSSPIAKNVPRNSFVPNKVPIDNFMHGVPISSTVLWWSDTYERSDHRFLIPIGQQYTRL